MSDDKYTAMLSAPRAVQHLSWPEIGEWGLNSIGEFEDIAAAKEAIREQGYFMVHGWPEAAKVEDEEAYVVMAFVFDPAIKDTRLCLIFPTNWLPVEAQ